MEELKVEDYKRFYNNNIGVLLESLKEYIEYLEEKKRKKIENKDELIKNMNYNIAENTVIISVLKEFEENLKEHIFNIENVKKNKKLSEFK